MKKRGAIPISDSTLNVILWVIFIILALTVTWFLVKRGLS